MRALKTEEPAETQKFYDGERRWRRDEFQYVFVLNWNKKMTFQKFPLKGKWENFQFRKIKKCVLSFPK